MTVRGRSYQIFVLAAALLFSGGFTPGTGTVVVPLFQLPAPASVRIAAEGGTIDLFAGAGSDRVARLQDGESVRIELRERELYATLPSGGRYSISFRAAPSGTGQIRLDAANSELSSSWGLFVGVVQLVVSGERRDSMQVSAEVDVERFVAAVVDRAYSMEELEAAKALAVVIRTQALHHASGAAGPVRPDAFAYFDGGLAARSVAERAARETVGEVLTAHERLVFAPFHESSGGQTADNERVWEGDALPHLRATVDANDSDPERSWRAHLAREELLRFLAKRLALSATDVIVDSRSRDGRVRTVAVLLQGGGRHHLPGERFRQLANECACPGLVRSTNFALVRSDDAFVFEGVGSGHGVGLPIWGAHGMAARGAEYTLILDHYFSGTNIQQWDTPSQQQVRGLTARRARTARVGSPDQANAAPLDVPTTGELSPSANDDDGARASVPAPSAPADTVRTTAASAIRIGW